MNADLKPYPAMKNSGVPGLGKVPKHWEVRRLKTLCSRSALYGANVPATSYTSTGVRFLRTTDITDDGRLRVGGVFLPEDAIRDYLLAEGDLLVSRSGTIGRSFLYAAKTHGPCAYAGYLVRFVPASEVLPKYAFLFTKTQAFAGFLRVMAISSTIENVNGEKYANSSLTLPPLPEQAAIVRFLDYVDRRIRRYIRAKQKLIKLLEEQKQAIIHHAVTRGLDPNVRLKASGIPWFDDIPAHWNTISLGAACELIQTGPFGSQLHSHEYVEGGVPVINPSHLHDGRIVPDRSITIDQSKASELERHKLRIGDIVAARRGELGRCGLVTATEQGWICGTGSLRICAKGSFYDSAYLVQLFSSQAVRDSLTLSSIGATMDNLNAGMVARLRLPLPRLDEQRRVVRLIETEEKQSALAVSIVDREISLLREYRTRLIADVVTGKVDVREAAARLPDEVEESEPLEESEADTDVDADAPEEVDMLPAETAS